MCKKSESITEIAKALVKFNAEVKMIEKDAKNPHFKNNYATLDTIIDEIRPILTKHGLSIMQFPGGDGEVFTMTTMLLHESGEWIESQPIVMKPVRNDPQGIGSCATYARRYSLAAFLSLNTGEDDDGHNASYSTPQSAQSTQTKEQTIKNIQAGPMLSESQANYALKLKKDKRVNDQDFRRMVAELSEGNPDLYQMSKKQAIELINLLNNIQMA
jgi:hypothetical protein